MEVEDEKTQLFFKETLPLDHLNDSQLSEVVKISQTAYRKRDHIMSLKSDFIYLIRKGAVQISGENQTLKELIGEHDWFGYKPECSLYEHRTVEDTLYYRIPKETFFNLCGEIDIIQQFFNDRRPSSITSSAASDSSEIHLLGNSVMQMSRAIDPYIVNDDEPIRSVAKLMNDKNVTAVMITTDGKLSGIVTDRAFCTKVVADQIDSSMPISRIMTKNPLTIEYFKSGVEAMLIMARQQVRHLPIVKKEKVVGIITAADLLRKQSHNVVFLISEIQRAENIKKLQQISKQIPLLLLRDVDANMDEHDIAYSVSSVGRAINQRLVKLAEDKFGEPPVSYAWVVAGSLARNEQILHSDQDNLMILSDEYDSKKHQKYFKSIAKFVNDGLNECGYIYCPGDVMAVNDRWRQPVTVWKDYFKEWIESPEPKALMLASIFFDIRCIYGDSSLFYSLRDVILEKTKKNSRFQAFMANNALMAKPPIGFFRNFILDASGERKKALNLKKRGVTPVIDYARTYALANGISSVNTVDRINALVEMKGLSKKTGADMIDAFKFINTVRIKHQAKQLKNKQEPDNYVDPQEIHSLDKKHLKDAFNVVEDGQSTMGVHFNATILS